MLHLDGTSSWLAWTAQVLGWMDIDDAAFPLIIVIVVNLWHSARWNLTLR